MMWKGTVLLPAPKSKYKICIYDPSQALKTQMLSKTSFAMLGFYKENLRVSCQFSFHVQNGPTNQQL